MSDLISREALLKDIKSNRLWLNGSGVIEVITNAPAIEQGEPIGKIESTDADDYSTQYWGELDMKAFGDGKWKVGDNLYTTPQQPQSVADALEEALCICSKMKTPDNFTDAEKHIFEQATTEYWRAIRTLITRNAEGVE